MKKAISSLVSLLLLLGMLPPVPATAYVEQINHMQKPRAQDYSFMWWADGLRGENGGFNYGSRRLNIQTGYYGLTMDPEQTGGIVALGGIHDAPAAEEAQKEDNSRMDALPAIRMFYAVELAGSLHEFAGVEPTATEANQGSNALRQLESGRYMQRADVMNLTYGGTDTVGRIEVAATPEYFTLTYEAFAQQSYAHAGLNFSIQRLERYPHVQYSQGGRAVTMTDGSGAGLSFILPQDANIQMELVGGTLTFFAREQTLPAKTWSGFSVAVIPSARASAEDVLDYEARRSVSVSAVQISPDKGVEQPVYNNMEQGYQTISLANMFTKVLDEANTQELQNTYDQLTFSLSNPTDRTVRVPVQFVKDAPLSVTGMSPFLRDSQTGEPIGVQVQLTKNWHSYSTTYVPGTDTTPREPDDPARYWEGQWFHGYTLIEVPAHSRVSYDYTCAFAQWGGEYAVSHAQLCLAGWGGNQIWESASLGSFGESFTYDPLRAWNGSTMADICPALITSRVNGDKYNWTLNVGGGEFLTYYKSRGGCNMPVKRLKTNYKKQGPNVTEVVYSGVTADEKISFTYTVSMGRTNDGSKAVHSFSYTFLEDVPFDRFAFYSFGAESYNIGYNGSVAVGNNSGLCSFDVGSRHVDGVFSMPDLKSNGSYWNTGSQMQRISAGGEGLWFAFLDGQANPNTLGAGANKVLSVLDYNASINGRVYTQPSFNLRPTYMLDTNDMVVELCPDKAVGNTISKGSTVHGSVLFANLPVSLEDFYGGSTVIADMAAKGELNHWQTGYRYGTQSATQTQASVGTVESQYPIKVAAADTPSDRVFAQFTVRNGISYVPVTISGLPSYSGWKLQKLQGGAWVDVNQSVHGSDYWQAWFDADRQQYELSYNVHHDGTGGECTYRLIESEPVRYPGTALLPKEEAAGFYVLDDFEDSTWRAYPNDLIGTDIYKRVSPVWNWIAPNTGTVRWDNAAGENAGPGLLLQPDWSGSEPILQLGIHCVAAAQRYSVSQQAWGDGRGDEIRNQWRNAADLRFHLRNNTGQDLRLGLILALNLKETEIGLELNRGAYLLDEQGNKIWPRFVDSYGTYLMVPDGFQGQVVVPATVSTAYGDCRTGMKVGYWYQQQFAGLGLDSISLDTLAQSMSAFTMDIRATGKLAADDGGNEQSRTLSLDTFRLGLRENLSPGNVTGGQQVSAADLMQIKAYLTGDVALTYQQKKAADANRDGKIDVCDLAYVKRMIAGLE